ncbi:MAG: hypothetical protein JSW61_04480 [Candidatus Thorarchaeota archaeon]|nr:MAG: hypothetical protein JSW61_04480 [Candidatus Thorarchaeota archaeon]
MQDEKMKYLLKNKVVCDFRGFPIGRVRKVWYEDSQGPLVIVERQDAGRKPFSWEAIPLRAIESVTEAIRLKPPVFAE